MGIKLNYVRWIQGNKVLLYCEEKDKEAHLRSLGMRRSIFHRKLWRLDCGNKNKLASVLQDLNTAGFMFVGGLSGWNPSDIFVVLREDKLVSGQITEIVWLDREKTLTRIV